MGIGEINQNNEKPVKVTKIDKNSYKYEYADGTVKCVFEEENSVTYNKNQNKDIQVKGDWGNVSVFNGKNLQIDMGKHCTGVTLEKCKDSYINAQHNSMNNIDIKNSTNLTIDADPEDNVSSNGTDIKHPRYETFKVNDKTYDNTRMLNSKDAPAQDRTKIYDEQLFGGQSFKDIKIEGGTFQSGYPIGGVGYKKATFPNGDTVIRTNNGQYLEYNSKNNSGLKIKANAGDSLEINNANGMTIIDTKMNDGGVLNNSANCTYSSLNSKLNYFETLNCKNTKFETDFRDEIKVDGKKIKQ